MRWKKTIIIVWTAVCGARVAWAAVEFAATPEGQRLAQVPVSAWIACAWVWGMIGVGIWAAVTGGNRRPE